MKERFRALMDASAKRPGRAALLLVLCAALLGGPLVACQSRAPEESLPDGTYWATLSLSDWWTAGGGGDRAAPLPGGGGHRHHDASARGA